MNWLDSKLELEPEDYKQIKKTELQEFIIKKLYDYKYYEIKLEGLISKEYYNKIKSDLYKDTKYSFGEVIDNLGDVRFKISNLVFNHDPEFIITYQCSGRFYDRKMNILMMMMMNRYF